MANVAEEKTTRKSERTPLAREKLRRFLVAAGPHGATAHELAESLYAENSNVSRNRIRCLISALRWNGVKVVLVKDAGFLLGRYVLAEYIIVAEPARP